MGPEAGSLKCEVTRREGLVMKGIDSWERTTPQLPDSVSLP